MPCRPDASAPAGERGAHEVADLDQAEQVGDVLGERRTAGQHAAAEHAPRVLERLLGLADALARLRGGQRGCGYAESFRGCGTWPSPDAGIRRLVLLLEASR